MEKEERKRLDEILILSEKGKFYAGEEGKKQEPILVIQVEGTRIRIYTRTSTIELNLTGESNMSIRETSSYSYQISSNNSKVIHISKNR